MLKKALKLFLYLVLSVLLIIAAIGIHRAWDRYNPIATGWSNTATTNLFPRAPFRTLTRLQHRR